MISLEYSSLQSRPDELNSLQTLPFYAVHFISLGIVFSSVDFNYVPFAAF